MQSASSTDRRGVRAIRAERSHRAMIPRSNPCCGQRPWDYLDHDPSGRSLAPDPEDAATSQCDQAVYCPRVTRDIRVLSTPRDAPRVQQPPGSRPCRAEPLKHACSAQERTARGHFAERLSERVPAGGDAHPAAGKPDHLQNAGARRIQPCSARGHVTVRHDLRGDQEKCSRRNIPRYVQLEPADRQRISRRVHAHHGAGGLNGHAERVQQPLGVIARTVGAESAADPLLTAPQQKARLAWLCGSQRVFAGASRSSRETLARIRRDFSSFSGRGVDLPRNERRDPQRVQRPRSGGRESAACRSGVIECCAARRPTAGARGGRAPQSIGRRILQARRLSPTRMMPRPSLHA